MKTPIYDFARKYADSDPIRMHMPGHKGVPSLLGVESLDITEIDGADVLYDARGIIKESRENASRLFKSGASFYSTEGSSLSIRAMLYLILMHAKGEGKRPLILAARNAHKVFSSASALLDIDIDWILPKSGDSLISCTVEPDRLDLLLSSYKYEKPTAVYLTSPDYLGNIADISGIARVCRSHGVLLAVDNAHGAYLAFLEPSMHPIALGAHVCADSAHKTLPVLTGGGYLHVSKDAPEIFFTHAERAMSTFASTSPSYLILQSLDLANDYLDKNYRKDLSAFTKKVDVLKKRLSETGYLLIGSEPLKLTVSAKSYGYTGSELADILFSHGIICEFSDPDFTVLMMTPESSEESLERLSEILLSIEKRVPIETAMPSVGTVKRVLSPRDAMLSPACEIPIHKSVGRILACESVGCPPAIPIVICGEEISEDSVRIFEYYGIKTVICTEKN